MSVVVGYVPDSTGLLAVRQAAQQARWRDTELVVVNVVGPAGYAMPTAADEKTLDALGAELTADGVRFAIRYVDDAGSEKPAEVILAVARETAAELIVVGIKRRSAVAKAVLGSTAQSVLVDAPCPVLSVRSED